MEPTTELPPLVTGDDGNVLPTYEAATNRDPLTLIAPYARRADLFSASLVSRQWREAFMKEIWEHPDRLWELGDRPVLSTYCILPPPPKVIYLYIYIIHANPTSPAAKFLLFLRTLSTTPHARPHARSLSLAGVQASIYSTLPAKWLSQVFLRLPDLQCLALSSFPFFDHSSLSAISPPAHANLQTLYATACTNTSASSLTHLLSLLPHLVNLDLSGTNGAAHPSTLSLIATQLPLLRCLSLRELKLDDAALSTVIRGLGTRLRKLDVAANLLTDATVAQLLDWSFAPPEYYTHTSTCPTTESPDVGASRGLTHLRIAANGISSRGVQELLKSTRLETLDVGAGPTHGVAPALALYAWNNLATLRIGCSIVLHGLRPGGLKALRNLVLCKVPVAAQRRFTEALVALVRGLEQTGVEVLELEMETGAAGEDIGMYSSSGGGAAAADFSFFSGDPREGEGGSSWMGEGGADGGGEVDVVEAVGAFRKRCRETKSGWGGKIRVVRDLGGRGSIERGIGGERWGVVREGV